MDYILGRVHTYRHCLLMSLAFRTLSLVFCGNGGQKTCYTDLRAVCEQSAEIHRHSRTLYTDTCMRSMAVSVNTT